MTNFAEKRALACAIGNNARLAIKAKGMTLAEFATAHNIPRDVLYAFVYGTQLPGTYNLVRMAKALGVSLDYLCRMGNVCEEVFYE